MVEVLQFLYKSICFSIDGLPIFVVLLHLNVFGMDFPIKVFSVFLTNLSVLLRAFVLAALLVEN